MCNRCNVQKVNKLLCFASRHQRVKHDVTKSDKRCFKCNKPIYFSSRRNENGKAILLDPHTNEAHLCRDEDIEDFKRAHEYEKSNTESICATKHCGHAAVENTTGHSTFVDEISYCLRQQHDYDFQLVVNTVDDSFIIIIQK